MTDATLTPNELADALESLALTHMSKQSAEALPALLSELRRLPELPTKPGSVILDATTWDKSHYEHMMLQPDGRWAGNADDGLLLVWSPSYITSWTPGRILAGPEPTTLAEAVADWCERHGWDKYTYGQTTPKREQVHVYDDSISYTGVAFSGTVGDAAVAWVKPADSDKEVTA